MFGVTTTAKSASHRIASAAKRSTSSWKDGASSANSTTLPGGAAFAYSLNDGTGTISLLATWPERILISSAAPLPTTIRVRRLADQLADQPRHHVLRDWVVQHQLVDLAAEMLEERLRREVQVVQVGVIDEAVTPVAAVLGLQRLVLGLASGSHR